MQLCVGDPRARPHPPRISNSSCLAALARLVLETLAMKTFAWGAIAGVAMTVFAATGCSGASPGADEPSDETASTNDALKTKSADAALADLLAHAPKPLTHDYADRIVRAALTPALTTTRLLTINQFAAKQHDDGDVYEAFAGNIQVLYGSVPRDLVSTPAGFGGQSFAVSVDVTDGMVGPTSFKVSGTAKADYELELTLSDHRVKIARVPAGATARDTAKLVADAIAHDKDAIIEHIFDENGIGPKIGPYGGLDDLESSATGDTVTITEAING